MVFNLIIISVFYIIFLSFRSNGWHKLRAKVPDPTQDIVVIERIAYARTER